MAFKDNDVYIVDAVRTPIGKAHAERGIYREVHAQQLLSTVYASLAERQPEAVGRSDSAFAGCVNSFGEQGGNIARLAWLAAGLPLHVPAMSVDVRCGSGQQAINIAAGQIAAGIHDIVVAGGVEHMGHSSFAAVSEIQATYGTPYEGALLQNYPIQGQFYGAELIAAEYGVQRSEMDEFALESHRKAHAATRSGAFTREMTRVPGHDGPLEDQGIREGSTIDQLQRLRPVLAEGGRITAATSSQVSDGAAAVVLASGRALKRWGLVPRARIVAQAFVGCDPVKMLEGPIPATHKILKDTGLTLDAIDAVEVNEAFASVALAWRNVFDADMAKVNLRGGAIALGHPLGSSGARLITSLTSILEDGEKELGLVTMCCGGGLGTATLIEVV